jgi:hypothetical protein
MVVRDWRQIREAVAVEAFRTPQRDLPLEKIDRFAYPTSSLRPTPRGSMPGPMTRQPIILLFSSSTGTVQRMMWKRLKCFRAEPSSEV